MKIEPQKAVSPIAQRMAETAKARVQTENTTLMGEPVVVVGMMAGEKYRVMDVGYSRAGGKTVPVYAKLFPAILIATVRDPQTMQPIFASADEINPLDSEEVDRVATIGLRLSGMDDKAAEAGKDDSPAPEDG